MDKDTIKSWLKTSGHTREWLGEQIGVSKKTVDNWLSLQDIPAAKLALIRRLMADEEAAEKARAAQLSPQTERFSIECTFEEMDQFGAAAKDAGKTLKEWALDTLIAAADANAQDGSFVKEIIPEDLVQRSKAS